MKVVVLHGTARNGTTRRLTELFLQSLGQAEITEFCFPRDMDGVCLGCIKCIVSDPADCPHWGQMGPIVDAIRQADVVVAQSPVFVMGMTGGLKNFFDHMACAWLVHRPDPAMFDKVGVVISTAAGPCTGKLRRDIKQQFFFWGIPKTYTWGEAVGGGWSYLRPEAQANMERKAAALGARVGRRVGHARPGVKLRALFWFRALMEKRNLSPMKGEHAYWEDHGWLDGKRPWKP